MLAKIIYTIQQAWSRRYQLKRYLQDNQLQARSLADLDLAQLQTLGISTLVIDFDGVLAPHAGIAIESQLEHWLKASCEIFADNVFILSNNPTNSRKKYFAENYPKVKFIVAPQKKPYPDGINLIIAATECTPNSLLMIDDRLFTGILAAEIAGVKACFITKPIINLARHPLVEISTAGMRVFERLFVSMP